jgi:type IV pilus assembly protein PilB
MRLRLGDVLLKDGAITEEQLNKALEVQKTSGSASRLGEILISTGAITEDKLLIALSKRLHIPLVHVSDTPIDINAVKIIPKHIAVKHNLIATKAKDGVLTVYINDPLNYYAIEDIKNLTNMEIDVSICKKTEIIRAINEAYSEIETQEAAQVANKAAIGNERTPIGMEYTDISEESEGDTPVVSLMNSTLYKAYSAGASDIHFEPFENQTSVRIRVDGQIVDYLKIDVSMHPAIVARFKIMSNLDIAEKRAPQDGHFRAKLRDAELNVRVSIMPTIFGEKVVLRFMSQAARMDNANTFGMEIDDYNTVKSMLQSPNGIVYVTGPTGSGKTTTLYMIMEELAKRNVNIMTIEDPVEKNLERINQTQVNPLAGLTFESGLRTILRQDPDIILIGETRDSETASISVRAALTGHLVMSSLHTNDSVSAIVRLLDMGVEDYLLANSLVGVIAQRLVKKICPFCYEEYTPSVSELNAVRIETRDKLARGRGCHNCNNTGYKGRVAVHEILILDTEIRNMIAKKVPMQEIYDYVQKNGKIKKLHTGIKKLVLEKKTTIEEMLKLTYFVE